MKVGYTLTCKETYKFNSFDDMYIKNKTYTIITYKSEEDFVIKGELENLHSKFSTKKETRYMLYLYDYFYTQKELRKMKLKSL
ncbi:hypothetical protein M0Q50_05360 [bacterium]|jgi:Txe/YoeB family toxin of Txe-Axe toxin-antitoxin module|nr:hypothetical protein [bacterium]